MTMASGEPQVPEPPEIIYPERPMDTSDIDPATGECWGVGPGEDPLTEMS
jgi:hypothetical protein